MHVDLFHGGLGCLRIPRCPCGEVTPKTEGQNRSVAELRAAEPVEEVDVDDVLGQLQNVFLLCAEEEPAAANDHLQDV